MEQLSVLITRTYIRSRELLPRRIATLVPIILLCAIASCDRHKPANGHLGAKMPEILLELSVREDGTATSLWTTGIAIAIGENSAHKLSREDLPLTPQADAWLKILRKALPLVTVRAGELAILLDVPPLDAKVVVGNRGSSDGFGWVPNYVGINVQAFANTYGPPTEGATDRMVRITSHEYVHLLTYAYYPNHVELRQTPLDRALWTMFFEGIGDFVSVSDRWLPDEQGNYSPVTADTLQVLEPVFVERLEMLVTASDERERELRVGISMGKFDQKWGSLPVALWLHSEAKSCGVRSTLQAVFRLERDGVLALALRHAAPELRPRIEALQNQVGRTPDGADNRSITCLSSRQDS